MKILESVILSLNENSSDYETVLDNNELRAIKINLIEDDEMRQEVIEAVTKDNQTIGTVSYTIYKDSNEYHLYTIEVNEDDRRKGVATFLMKALQKVVGDNDIYFDTLTPSGKKLLDDIADYEVYGQGKLGANLYKGRIKDKEELS